MRSRVYIETSIVSYLVARPSKHVVAAAWQLITREWWDKRRGQFDLLISDAVIEEAGRGDANAAARRLDAVARIPVLPLDENIQEVAAALVRDGGLPPEASYDALHIAAAAVHEADYLLTWNCRHIDNAEKKPRMRAILRELGYVCPEICTPSELMGDDDERRDH
ncbi:MAG: type II toxin-antitoxin system VapC family toxin [Myxococcales bacterium]|nr:type II toxin-antitoxin system VapC family toxin [Myxococcales bacterium]